MLGFALEWGRGAGKKIQIGAPTLEQATDAYLARPRLRSEVHKLSLRQQFDRHLKDWLRLPLDDITKSMVAERHRSMAATPSAANHALKYFRTVWNHARRIHDLPEPPTMAVERYEEQPDGRIIEDLPAWQREIDDLQNPIHRVFYEPILYTGIRRSEALSLQWRNVREDHIHLPMTKNGRSFDLPKVQKALRVHPPSPHSEVFSCWRCISGEFTCVLFVARCVNICFKIEFYSQSIRDGFKWRYFSIWDHCQDSAPARAKQSSMQSAA